MRRAKECGARQRIVSQRSTGGGGKIMQLFGSEARKQQPRAARARLAQDGLDLTCALAGTEDRLVQADAFGATYIWTHLRNVHARGPGTRCRCDRGRSSPLARAPR